MLGRSIGIRTFIGFILLGMSVVYGSDLESGKVKEIRFSQKEVGQSLYSMATGEEVDACMTVRLPDDYDPQKSYPLLVYLRGRHGGEKGRIEYAQEIVGPKGYKAIGF